MVQVPALICSSNPGFLRESAETLAGTCRVLECIDVAELREATVRHQPHLAVVDLENAGDPSEVFDAVSRAQSVRRMAVLFFSREDGSESIPAEFGGSADGTFDRAMVGHLHHWNRDEVLSCVERLLAAAVPQSRVVAAQSPSERTTPAIATRCPALQEMLKRLTVAARHNVTILLIGETGSGKTYLAQQIHQLSERRERPFLHVACGALPGELIESELFGHVKGAFTSAHVDKQGKFVAAASGTVLLDEIDVLTPDQQVKLLRVIETGEFEPVGSNRTLRVAARIIAASNLDLQPLVESGRFRADLYYRLNMLKFEIPPLRVRLADIEPLARHFVDSHSRKFGVKIERIDAGFFDAVLHYPWPGNVRELENAVRSAVIYSENGELSADSLPAHIVACLAGPANDPAVAANLASSSRKSLGCRLEFTEKEIVEQALLRNSFSRTRTARDLGISRVTLYNKMKKYRMLPGR